MRPESEVTAEVVWIFPLLGTLEGACGERPWTRPLPGSVVWGIVVSLKVWREPLSSGSIAWEMFSCSVSWTALIICYLSREPKRVALPMLGTNKLETDWAYVIFQHEEVAWHDLHVMARCDVQSSGCLITRCWQAFECSAPVDPLWRPLRWMWRRWHVFRCCLHVFGPWGSYDAAWCSMRNCFTV